MTSVADQKRMWYGAVSKDAALFETFNEFVKDGMTKKDLEGLIKRRPDVYSRFIFYMDKLPDSPIFPDDFEFK